MVSKGGRKLALRIGALVVVTMLLLAMRNVQRPDGDDPVVSAGAYMDDGFLEFWDGEMWVNPHASEFNGDPGWVTNNASNYRWNKTAQVYEARWVGGSEEYAVAPVTFDPNVTRVRLELDIVPVDVGIDADLPIGLYEEDLEYRTASSVQFFFGRNATANFTALESYDTTGLYNGDSTTDSFSLGTSYHIVLVVDYYRQTARVDVSKTGSTTPEYNLTISGIGEFDGLPKVGVSTVGLTGGEARMLIDNFTAGYSYPGPGTIRVDMKKIEYNPGQKVDIEARYLLDTSGWIPMTDAPYKRINHATAWNDEERFWIIMGGEPTYNPSGYDLRDEVFIYYPENDTSVKMADAPMGLQSHACVWEPVAKRMILYGGWGGTAPSYHFEKETWAYDPHNDSWTQMSDGPTERANPTLVYNPLNGTILMCGGYNGGFLKDLWEYNYSLDTWNQLKDMPAAKVGHVGIWDSYNDRMIITHGEDGAAPIKNNNTWAYSRATDSWTTLTAGAPPRAYFAAAWDPASQNLFLIGGQGSGGLNENELMSDLWVYNTSTDEWSNVGQLPFTNRSNQRACWDTEGRQLIMYGGMSKNPDNSIVPHDEIWVFTNIVHAQSNVDMTLEVVDPDDNSVVILTRTTNTTGSVSYRFNLKSSERLGLFNCTITSNLGDRMDFNFTVKDAPNRKLHIASVDLDGVYDSNGYVNATVVLDNPGDESQLARLVLQVMNPKSEPLPPAMTWVTVDAGSQSTVKLIVNLPSQTRKGDYAVQVQLLTDLPRNGGYALDHTEGSFAV